MSIALPISSSSTECPNNRLTLDPRTYARGLSCVHCGLCLPACPTYTQTWNEADSPRGRIQLMLSLSDGDIQPSESVQKHLDQCLDCRACETICPSGVVYHELIEEMRPKLATVRPPAFSSKALQWIIFHILAKPSRLRIALMPARLLKKLNLLGMLPRRLRKMASMTPTEISIRSTKLPTLTRSRLRGAAKMRITFFQTCIGRVVYEKVDQQSIELLSQCGADVMVARSQLCCGAIHHHNNASEAAMTLARQVIDAIGDSDGQFPDFITTTVAGCGAMLRDYPHLLRDDRRYAALAKAFSSRVRDITELFAEIGLPAMTFPVNQTVTYHDACHLAHAQRVSVAPRKLLMQIPGLKLIALPESDTCCGAAGTYNITQPQMAADLANRKLKHIAETGCNTLVAGNVGCAMHLAAAAVEIGKPLQILHPVELIHSSVFGK